LSETKEEALYNTRQMDLPIHCLDMMETQATNNFIKGFDKLMTNSPARRKQDQKIRNFLAWQLIGNPDLSLKDENRLCKEGNY